MALSAGTRIGTYEIVAPIGAGGMGQVYRARDTKLDHEVAIKVLPDELAADEERVARFEREAKLLAQLNHTNIATLHGLEELDGERFLVLELVEGETLAERIARGPMPIDEAVAIFTQISEGLEAAHAKGVVHRDLKPANVMITADGHVKILDFGLAKAFQDEAEPRGDASQSQSPTLTKDTALGVILGTASYMSPEQARGKTVDKRTDLWAFGCCLYEALTGAKALAGETVTDTLAAIVNVEPDWRKLPETTPAPVRRLLKRCLAKKVRERLTDAGMPRIELAEPREDVVTSEAVPTLWKKPAALLLAGSVLGAVIALLFVSFRTSSAPVVRRLSITPPSDYIDTSLPLPDVDISPDGRWIAFVGRSTTLERRGLRTRKGTTLFESHLRDPDDRDRKRLCNEPPLLGRLEVARVLRRRNEPNPSGLHRWRPAGARL